MSFGINASNTLKGYTDSGEAVNAAFTQEGHLESAIHDPILPFGSVHTESLYPIFQTDAVYGLNTAEVLATTGHATGGVSSGGVVGTGNLFKCSTGTTALSFATLQSRRRLRYRAGQGIVGRFTALFSTPAALSILVAGFGTGESGFYFGYNGTSFGILYSTGGVREIQTLTVSAGAGGAENVTVKLNNIDTVVAVTSGTATNTAYQLSQATYPGWSATQRANTVIFLANDVGNKASTFSIASAGTTAGTFAETLAGAAATDTWIPQSTWSGDTLDGSGNSGNPSGFLLNPARGNVFQIGIQYLGFGVITFKVETTSEGNNPTWTTVHTIKYPNTSLTTSISQPSFPFTMAAYSAGSSTNVSVSCASFAGFVEGAKKLTGPRMTYVRDTNNYVGSTAATYYPLFTVRNERVYAGRANQAVVQLLSLSGAHDDATPITLYLIKNATLVGTPNFTQFAGTSCTYWDVAATTCTISTNDQIIYSLQIGEHAGDAFTFEDDITLQPGETVTLAGRAVTATATYVNASLNTREDQ
jgi:hypothetical protein